MLKKEFTTLTISNISIVNKGSSVQFSSFQLPFTGYLVLHLVTYNMYIPLFA